MYSWAAPASVRTEPPTTLKPFWFSGASGSFSQPRDGFIKTGLLSRSCDAPAPTSTTVPYASARRGFSKEIPG